MKKNLVGLLVMLLALVSCEGEQGPMGPAGPGMYWDIVWVTVEENEWRLVDDGDGPYFMCEKNVSGLTNDIYEEGNTFCYLVIRPNQANEVQTLLPYKIDLLEKPDYTWTETISWDFMPGSVAFYVQYTDFAVDIRPGRQVFRIVMNL